MLKNSNTGVLGLLIEQGVSAQVSAKQSDVIRYYSLSDHEDLGLYSLTINDMTRKQFDLVIATLRKEPSMAKKLVKKKARTVKKKAKKAKGNK